MAHVDYQGQKRPYKAASDAAAKIFVALDTVLKDQVVPITLVTTEPLGGTDQASSLRGDAVTVYEEGNVVKALCAASLGAGADVGIASTNGALGPVSGASGVSRYRVGKSREAAAPGSTFSVQVNPKQLSNLI